MLHVFNILLQVSAIQLILPPCFHTRLIHNVANNIESQNGALLDLTFSWYHETHCIVLKQSPSWRDKPPWKRFYSQDCNPHLAVIGFSDRPLPFPGYVQRSREHFSPMPTDWHHQTHSAGQYQDVPTDRLAEWLVYTCITAPVPTITALWENTLTRDISRNSVRYHKHMTKLGQK